MTGSSGPTVPARSTIEAEKERLREEIRARLSALSPAARAERGERAAEHLGALAELGSAKRVLLFRSLPSEVETAPLAAGAAARGQAVLFPRAAGDAMEFVAVGPSTRWRRGEHGVLEPEGGPILAAADLADGPTLLVAPGLAFAPDGARLGRGGGHYDRVLGASPLAGGRAFVVGLCFDLQVLDTLPVAAHDARVDLVVSESRVIRCRGGQ